MNARRAKQRRRLQRLEESGQPERGKVRARILDDPQPGSWNPATAQRDRERENRSKRWML